MIMKMNSGLVPSEWLQISFGNPAEIFIRLSLHVPVLARLEIHSWNMLLNYGVSQSLLFFVRKLTWVITLSLNI